MEAMVIFREFLTLEDTYNLRHLLILRAALSFVKQALFKPVHMFGSS